MIGSRGDGGANWLYGWDGNDELHGRGGADHLLGLDDNDLLDGGEGADFLDGGNGVDTAYYGSAPSAVNVSLESGKGFWGDSAGDTLTLIENLTGSAYNDLLIGDSNANVLDGGKGDDYLKGGGGADTLEGGDGSDTIAYGDLNIGVYVSLYSGAAFNGTASGDQFDSIENLAESRSAAAAHHHAGAGENDHRGAHPVCRHPSGHESAQEPGR